MARGTRVVGGEAGAVGSGEGCPDALKLNLRGIEGELAPRSGVEPRAGGLDGSEGGL